MRTFKGEVFASTGAVSCEHFLETCNGGKGQGGRTFSRDDYLAYVTALVQANNAHRARRPYMEQRHAGQTTGRVFRTAVWSVWNDPVHGVVQGFGHDEAWKTPPVYGGGREGYMAEWCMRRGETSALARALFARGIAPA